MRRLLTTAVLLLTGLMDIGAAFAQPILLSGTVGKAPIFLELDRTGDTVSGWYFYLKAGKQIRLQGKLDPKGFFQMEAFDGQSNSHTGTFTGRMAGGRWSGSWKEVRGLRTRPLHLTEVRDTLRAADGRVRCTAKLRDREFRSSQSIDLTLKSGRVQKFTASLSTSGLDGDDQRCSIALKDLKQLPAKAGILLAARQNRSGSEHRCTIRLYGAGDYLVARIGDPRQDNDDCRGAGQTQFCSQRAFWLGMSINRQTQTCKQVK